ncbi:MULTISPECIES: DUF1761 domain-containing protein [unclassified Imperialibacter]|uniref:DUF1761 domain-containing protein n=1 Tax=unclassified Imperialibacter TaxID=2629706 RepID=UPI00125BCF57|nr:MULTISPECIES: DUF1761 domain-containing protein [unclassified Imperialibacter]CAD5270284.1 conserved membrane hypothetical protein [Imperialibacter sp. 89]CAD5298113.1 conserved membrane hypothetical protein [Imperialibacter sp. 75]VVT34293.1 conserved membrane hypothetical protein [Imperialibacter sp. EC-SDR9]
MKTLKINHWAILVIVVLGQVIPALWYGMFAETWMRLNNLTEADVMSGGSTPYISSVITAIVFAYVLAWLFKRMNVGSAADGAKTAFIMAVSFSLLMHMTVNFFSMRPYGLAWVDGGADLVVWTLAGTILGGWRKYEN